MYVCVWKSWHKYGCQRPALENRPSPSTVWLWRLNSSRQAWVDPLAWGAVLQAPDRNFSRLFCNDCKYEVDSIWMVAIVVARSRACGAFLKAASRSVLVSHSASSPSLDPPLKSWNWLSGLSRHRRMECWVLCLARWGHWLFTLLVLGQWNRLGFPYSICHFLFLLPARQFWSY